MKLQWLSENGFVSLHRFIDCSFYQYNFFQDLNGTNVSNVDIPEFEYYDLINWIIREYLVYAVIFSQFFSWFLGSAAFTVTHFKWWNLLMLVMFGICLPVDVLIFYAEPFGVFGTLATTILAFAPFVSMVADSTFPLKNVWVKGRSNIQRKTRQ